jgi:hypothetical protein
VRVVRYVVMDIHGVLPCSGSKWSTSTRYNKGFQVQLPSEDPKIFLNWSKSWDDTQLIFTDEISSRKSRRVYLGM